MFGLGNIKEKLEEAKIKAEETKARLDSVHVEGNSGDFVTVIATANSQILQVMIKQEAQSISTDELGRHMLVATNNALVNARAVYEAEMGAVARDAMPNIPGMPNLGNMFK
ncbi:MAG: YbaB/EbfC family nucleoid-associated protein [Salibacteraceae bacterium]